MLTSSRGRGWLAVLTVNWVCQATGCDTKKYRVGLALVVRPVCPSGASRSIVGSGAVTLMVPRDAPPTRPPGAPRGGGLYAGVDAGVSSCCASAAGSESHNAAMKAAAKPLAKRLIANFRSAERAPNKRGVHSAGR